ncbi:MAG: 3-hydroxyacyl-CoA dehydrogenase NAD-binding domain-containing protein [Acidimicrobiia bacterium]
MRFQNPLLAKPARPHPSRIAVVGAGTIGPDIGYYLKSNLPNLELVLVDVARKPLDAGIERIETHVRKGLARNKLTESQAGQVMENLIPTLDYNTISDSEWVIEAASEDLAIKREIFGRVESIVRDDTLITSNTSSLPAERLFADLKHPERATVTHFFAPAFQNPIVEVVDWERIDSDVVDFLRWFFARTGKVPLVTSDVPCFMLDRVFDNWCNEAGYLLDEATAAEVDHVAGEFVHAGPFFVLNLANGNPIIIETNTLQMLEEGEHYRPAPVFRSVDSWNTVSPGEPVDVGSERAARIRDRLLGILFSQAVDILDRTIGSAADLELGCELALGFKKGPLRLMEELGSDEVGRILEVLADERTGMPMPVRPLAGYQGFTRHLLVDDVDGVKVITLRRPHVLNALDDELNDELLAVLEDHEDDPAVEGFVITGYGTRAFCAGADIGRFPEMLGDADACAQYARDCSRVLIHLDSMKKPVVAALNGMALGGGLELAFRCHGMVAVEDAWLQLPEATLGIAPGVGGMVIPYRRWPSAAPVFHDMMRRATKLSAREAHRLGIIGALVIDTESLIVSAVDMVRELEGEVAPPPEGPVEIPPFPRLEPATLAEEGLSSEVVDIIEAAIRDAAMARELHEALEIGYSAFGAAACTKAAREKITVFISGERG